MHTKRLLTVYAFYLGIAVLVTWPLAQTLTTRFAGHSFGDTYEYTRHIWWIQHALKTGEPPFGQPLLGYPDGLDGAWLWGAQLQSFPAWLLALFMPLPLAFNIVTLLRLALNGWAMYVLMEHILDGRRGPALLAGLVFMLFPAFQGQLALGHIGLLALWPVPLFIHAVLRQRWLAGAIFWTLGLLGSPLMLVFIVGPATVLLLVITLAHRDWRGLRRLVMAVMLGGGIALIFMVPVLMEQQANLLPREGGDVRYSADLLSLVTPSLFHPLFGQLDYTRQVLGQDPFERMAYVGIVAAVLGGIALWRRPESRWWLVLAVVAWVMSLGPLLKVLDQVVIIDLDDRVSFVSLPWMLIQNLPVLGMVRTPARFNFAVALAVAVMAGYGAAVLWRGRLRWLVIAGLMALVVFEYQSVWPLPAVSGTMPEAVQALRARDDIRAVMDLPWRHLLAQKDGMYLQTGHQKPLVAGHVTRRTPVNPAKLAILQDTLDLALLDRAGVDIVIWHKAWASSDGSFLRAQLGDPSYEDRQIAIFEVPDPADQPQFTVIMTDERGIEDSAESYVYVPEPGWVTLSGDATAPDRRLALRVGRLPVGDWDGSSPAVLPITEAGYHTVTLAVEPPCPDRIVPPLDCRTAEVNHLALNRFTPDTFDNPVSFERGITLAGSHIVQDDGTLTLWLWWQFDRPVDETLVRFVHVLDAAGNLVAQSDESFVTGGGLAESVSFDALPAGTYTVYTGWYTLPDVTRLAVLSSAPDAANGWVRLGEIEAGG